MLRCYVSSGLTSVEKLKKKDLVCTNKVNCNLFGATETFYSCVFISFYSSNVCIKNSTAFLDKHQRNFK